MKYCGVPLAPRNSGERPGDQAPCAATAFPGDFKIVNRPALLHFLQRVAKTLGLFRYRCHQIPDETAANVGERVTGGFFAHAIKSHDAHARIEHHYQRAHRIQDRGSDVALLLQRFLGALQLRDVEGDAVDEPGAAVVVHHHFGFALKPDHVPVARDHAIAGADRFAGEKHFGGFHRPAVLIVGMDLLIPADGIFQPFVARESERDFNVRTDVRLPDALIQIGGKNHGGDLLHQRAVSGFYVGRDLQGARSSGRISIDRNSTSQLGEQRFRLDHVRVFVEERIQGRASHAGGCSRKSAAQQATVPHRSVHKVRGALAETVSR